MLILITVTVHSKTIAIFHPEKEKSDYYEKKLISDLYN